MDQLNKTQKLNKVTEKISVILAKSFLLFAFYPLTLMFVNWLVFTLPFSLPAFTYLQAFVFINTGAILKNLISYANYRKRL